MPKATPDHIYDPDNWECTYGWDTRDQFVADQLGGLMPGEVKCCATLIDGPMKYVARVVLTRDEDGEPDDTEVRWFDDEEAARAAGAK